MKTSIIGFIVAALIIGALYVTEISGGSNAAPPARTAPADDLGGFK